MSSISNSSAGTGGGEWQGTVAHVGDPVPSQLFSPYTIGTSKLTLMSHLGGERLYFGPPAMTRRSDDGEALGKNVLWSVGKDHRLQRGQSEKQSHLG